MGAIHGLGRIAAHSYAKLIGWWVALLDEMIRVKHGYKRQARFSQNCTHDGQRGRWEQTEYWGQDSPFFVH